MQLLKLVTLLLVLPVLASADTVYKRGVVGASGSSSAFGGQTYSVPPGTMICNADCAVATSQCAPGTPMALAIAAATASNPTRVLVLPGVHDECVSIAGNVGLVVFEQEPGAIVHPAATIGGAVRVGNNGVLRGTGPVRIVNNGLQQTDSFGAPEAALQIGPEVCFSATDPSWTDVEVTGSGRFVGHHDGVQACGDQLVSSGASTKQLARLWVHDTHSFSGRDACTVKGNTISLFQNVECTGWSNYCEDKSGNTHLGAVSTTATGGTTTSVVINGADKYGENGGYANRLIRFSDADGGGAGVCGTANADNGLIRASNGYNESSGTIFFVSTDALPTAPTSGCAVTIDAVARVEESPCDTHWRLPFSTGGALGSHWKVTGFHNGLGAPSATGNSSLDSLLIEHSLLRAIVNDAVLVDASCNSVTNATGYLAYDDAQFGEIRLASTDVRVEVNADQELMPSCAFPIGGVKVTGNADLDALRFSGSIQVRNNAAIATNTAGVVADSTIASPVTLDATTIQITTPGGFTGTATPLVATSPDTLAIVGPVSSPDLLTVSSPAQVSGWDEINVPMAAPMTTTTALVPLGNAIAGGKIQMACCACLGTCTGTQSITLAEVVSGNAIGGTINCSDGAGTITYTDVSTDADGTLTGGETARITAGSFGVGDVGIVKIRATTNRF